MADLNVKPGLFPSHRRLLAGLGMSAVIVGMLFLGMQIARWWW